MGFKPHLSRGEKRTIIGVIGDEERLQVSPLSAIPRRRAGAADPQAVQARQAARCTRATASSSSAATSPASSRARVGGGALGDDRRAVRRRERPKSSTRSRGQVKAAGANIPARRRVQAAHQPVQLPGPRRRRVGHPARRSATSTGLPGRHRGDGPAPGRPRGALRRHVPARRPATCRTSTCLKEVGQTRLPVLLKARHERHRQGHADVGGVHPLGGQTRMSCCASAACVPSRTRRAICST